MIKNLIKITLFLYLTTSNLLANTKFFEDAEESYEVYFDYQNFEEYKDEMLRFDQSRKPRFEKLEALMRSRFQELGKSIDQRIRFYQPMLARCFRVL